MVNTVRPAPDRGTACQLTVQPLSPMGKVVDIHANYMVGPDYTQFNHALSFFESSEDLTI